MGRRLTAREKLAVIEQQRKDLKRQVREEDKEQQSERNRIAGSVLYRALEGGELDKELWRSLLEKYLVKPKERLLFGLEVDESAIADHVDLKKETAPRNNTDLSGGELKSIMDGPKLSERSTESRTEFDKLSQITGRTTVDLDDDDLAAQFNTVGIDAHS